MFRPNKYAPILAISALASSNTLQTTQAVRTKADAQWHLAMVPDSESMFDAPSSFMSTPRHFGFGLSSNPFIHSGSFAEDGPSGFGDFAMPSFNFGSSMQDMMR